MDDQELDPIAEALSAVTAQFAGDRAAVAPDQGEAPDADEDADLLDATPADDADAEPSDDTDTEDSETEAQPPAVIPWEDPASPYHAQFLQAQEVARQRDEEAAKVQRTQDFLAALRAAKETEDAKAFHAQLQEIDPQLAQQWLGQRTGLVQQAAQAQQATVGYQHGLAALHLAMVDALGEEQAQQVVAAARTLAAQPGLEAMRQAVQARRQAVQGNDAKVAQLEAAVRELTARLSAKSRPKAADVVDSAPKGAARATRPEDTENMDDFFAAWTPQLRAHFGG